MEILKWYDGIKDCPFCGAKAKHGLAVEYEDLDVYVFCFACKAHGPLVGVEGGKGEAISDAVYAWNIRKEKDIVTELQESIGHKLADEPQPNPPQ